MTITSILKVSKCPMYLDTEFVRYIFNNLDIGEITNIYTELVTQQERTTKGNRLHDTKKTYYKNVYITVTNSDETLEELFIKNDNHLIVKYSVDEFWDVYKCSEVPSFKPKLYRVNPKLTYL